MKHTKITLARMLHGECYDHKTTKLKNAALVLRIKELIERRNDLQVANNAYLERARKAEAWTRTQAAEIHHWRANSVATWEAMQTMRNDINEVVPLPSLEADLLEGPENSIFCATVARNVLHKVKEQGDTIDYWIDEARKWAGLFANKRIEAETHQYTALRWQRRAQFWLASWFVAMLAFVIMWALA